MVLSTPPAVVIIARHGARLDAANDQWVHNATEPYNTPLSYGGWTQTRALGARIASLLHARDMALAEESRNSHRRNSNSASDQPPLPSPRPPTQRKHKVIIHSSPFLRCIQSSIAISAGMGHHHGNLARVGMVHPDGKDLPDPSKSPRLFAQPSRSQTLDSRAFDERLSRASSILDGPKRDREEKLPEFQKPTMRVDAFLGEWLSPEYYEFIAAPPESNMMVAGAKAELLKSAEPIRGAKIVGHDGSVKVFQGADSSPSAQQQQQEEQTQRQNRDRGVSFSMEDLARQLPSHGAMSKSVDRGKEAGTSNGASNGASAGTNGKATEKHIRNTGYIPPTPTYALLPKAPIPAGYVAHARDQCVDIDFSWDSMREPQTWGDGGQYGEEWSSMHRRFRSGLASMISWYKSHGPYFDPQLQDDESGESKDSEDSAEVALVIVTHGAGCNALIGALTNQPVLMDVGMGSLTMAVRTPTSATSPPAPQRTNSNAGYRRRRSSSVDIGLSQEYEMKLIASTEHLRAGADPLTIPQLAGGSAGMPSIPESNPASGSSTPRDRAGSFSKNSALGSMRRTSVKSKSSRAYSPSPVLTSATSSGLWGGSGSLLENIEPVSLSPVVMPSGGPETTTTGFNNSDMDRFPDSGPGTPNNELAVATDSPPQAQTQAPKPPAPAHRQGLWGSTPDGGPGRQNSMRSRR